MAVMVCERSVSTERNDSQILRIRVNKSRQMGHGVVVMKGGRSACIPRTQGRLLGAPTGGQNLHFRDGERNRLVAFWCHSVRG